MSNSAWDRKNYEKYDHHNFKKYKPFFQKINYEDFDASLANAICFILTNDQRAANKLPPLAYAIELEISAYHHSRLMAEKKFFSHKNHKDKARETTEKRGLLAGIKNPKIAENINDHYMQANDSYFSMAEKLLDSWMKSPGHRSNILSTKGKSMGCGVYFEGEWSSNRNYKQIKATQNFQWFEEIISTAPADSAP